MSGAEFTRSRRFLFCVNIFLRVISQLFFKIVRHGYFRLRLLQSKQPGPMRYSQGTCSSGTLPFT